MTPHTRTGFRRLAIFAAILAGSAYLFAMTLTALSMPSIVVWRVMLFLLITTPLVSTLAWLLIRGLAWVSDGFARRQNNFHKPNWN